MGQASSADHDFSESPKSKWVTLNPNSIDKNGLSKTKQSSLEAVLAWRRLCGVVGLGGGIKVSPTRGLNAVGKTAPPPWDLQDVKNIS